QIGGEGAVPNPGHPKLKGTDAGLHLPLPVAVSIAEPVLRALIRLRFKVLSDLGLEYLVEHRLHKLGDTFVAVKKLMQQLGIYANLIVGHPLGPPVGLVWSTQPIPGGGGWPFLVARPPCRFYTVYWTLLANSGSSLSGSRCAGVRLQLCRRRF